MGGEKGKNFAREVDRGLGVKKRHRGATGGGNDRERIEGKREKKELEDVSRSGATSFRRGKGVDQPWRYSGRHKHSCAVGEMDDSKCQIPRKSYRKKIWRKIKGASKWRKIHIASNSGSRSIEKRSNGKTALKRQEYGKQARNSSLLWGEKPWRSMFPREG